MAIFLMANTGCEEIKKDPGKYIDATGKVVTIAKDTEAKGTTAEKIKAYVDSAQQVNAVVTTVAPTPYGVIAAGVLGITSTILGLWVKREKKKVVVVKEKSKGHEDMNNNYREALNAGIADGENKEIIPVKVLKEILDKSTKEHFNKEGEAKI